MNDRMKVIAGRLSDWLDDRTGYKELMHEGLYENIPGGSRWIYVTGSMLVFAFVTQAITGIFLWMYYSPGSQNAWESVYHISNTVKGGWLLRGVHHYMAQMMVVLLPLHLMQVVLCKAYTAPREINYWLGLVLMNIVLGLGLTGYLLPWDQKGYWATKVATELMSLPPGGDLIQKVVVGGSEYGHSTLTRFFAMHAGVLPALLIGVLALHVAMFRKHGITAHSSENRADEYFWPMQVFKDAAGCFAMLAFVVILTCFRQAELGPPAEPTQSYGAARPEWYFLFLFQLLKQKWIGSEFIGAIVIPGLVMAFLFALPLIAKVKFGHIVNCTVIVVLVIGAGYLTYEAFEHDNYNSKYAVEPTDPAALDLWKGATAFHEAKEQAEQDSVRVKALVDYYGIPRGGALELVNNDPEIQGPRIFKQKCAGCHAHTDNEGHGIPGPAITDELRATPAPIGGPNLHGVGSVEWIAGLLKKDEIVGERYFGFTAHGIADEDGKYPSEMVQFILGADHDEDNVPAIAAALSAEANLVWPSPASADLIHRGRELLSDDSLCASCHTFRDVEVGGAPELTGYMSVQWLRDFIADPDHERFYMGNNDRMPAFGKELSAHEIDMLARWLRRDDRDLSLKLASRSRAVAEGAGTESTTTTQDSSAEGRVDSDTEPAKED
jgi:ubiquinol-cytochrome c reductase cytochrome b subunit